MDLVGQGVGKEDHVQLRPVGPGPLIGDGLDGVVQEVGIVVAGAGQEALQQLPGAVQPDQHLGPLGDGGKVARTVAVEDVVPFGDIAGGDEAVGGIGHISQGVHGGVAGGLVDQGAVGKELHGGVHGVGAIANVGGAGLDGGQGLVVQGGGTDDEVGLGGVVGDGEAQELHGLPVVVVLVGAADQGGLDKAGVVVLRLSGDVDDRRLGHRLSAQTGQRGRDPDAGE